MNKQILSYP